MKLIEMIFYTDGICTPSVSLLMNLNILWVDHSIICHIASMQVFDSEYEYVDEQKDFLIEWMMASVMNS